MKPDYTSKERTTEETILQLKEELLDEISDLASELVDKLKFYVETFVFEEDEAQMKEDAKKIIELLE